MQLIVHVPDEMIDTVRHRLPSQVLEAVALDAIRRCLLRLGDGDSPDAAHSTEKTEKPDKASCNLCRRSQDEVKAFVAIPGDVPVTAGGRRSIYICDECLGNTVECMAAESRGWRDKQIEALERLRSNEGSRKS